MEFEPAIAVLDASVLYPFHLRNILVQAAVDRLVDARWTDTIHDEWIRALVARRPAVPRERLLATRQLMNEALPQATVVQYEHHIHAVNLPDPDDRHVVAAGIASQAAIILTWNLRDFPAKELKRFRLRRDTPDGFLSGVYDDVPELMIESLANARRNLKRSRISASDFVESLRNQRLVHLAQRVEKHLKRL